MAVAAIQAIGAKVITATVGFAYLTPTAALLAGTATIALGAAALRALAPKPSLPKVSGYNVTSRGAALDHQVVYGRTRVAGVEVFKATTGTDNAYLHLVLAFTGHEIEAFEEIWINDQKATLDGNGNVTTVTSEDGSTASTYNNKMTIIKRLGGTDNDTPPAFGSSPDRPTDAGWTSAHKLTGISYLYCRLKFDRDAFPSGVPEIQATIKGKKVYNPDTATTEWSDNPALCIRDYLTSSTYGLGESSDSVDDTLFVSAYEACEETATYNQSPTIWGSSVTIGSKKFTLNGSFTTGAKPADVLEDMLTSMGGTLWYAQGKWRVKAAKWYAPTVTLDENDLRSGVTVNTRHSSRDNFNTIQGTFKGIESNYVETDYPQFPNDDSTNAFITVDNGQKNVVDIPLAFTSDSVTARRLARIALERHRQQITVSASFGMKAFQLQVGDVVNLTNSRMGWSSKPFEVVSWTFTTGQDFELLVDMTLRETAETAFDEEDDSVIYERDNTTLFSPFFVPSVSLDSPFSSNAMNSDGTAVPFIDFSWTATDPSRIDYYVFEWSTDAGVTYNPTTTSGTTFRLSPTETGKTYLYRVTPYNYLGVSGTTVTSAVGIAATADGTTPNAPTSLSASGGYRTATVTWTEPTTNTDASALTDLKYYRVYRGTTTSPTTEVGVTFSNIFTDGGLADATQYYYRVKAVDRTGNESAYSTETNVTTNAELVDGVDGVDGADGSDGNSVALLGVYKRASSAPTTPTGGSFNFSTNTLTPPTGWSATPPSGSDPLYISNATASVQGSTGTDSSLTWSQPEVFAENGQDGADGADGEDGTAGKSVYTAIVFNRYSSAPSTPTGGSFNFGTNTLTPPTGWLLDVPSGSDPVYGTRAVFSITGDTGTDSSATWSTPFKIAEDGIDGVDGEEGADGLSTFLASVFLRSASAPSTPTGGSYNFGTNTLTAPSGWNTSVPSGSNPLYVSTALASVQGVTGTDSSLSWTSPVILAQDGADGEDGAAGDDGPRGAGRWYVGVSSLPTTSSGADSEFTSALFDPVDRDQAWFYTGTVGSPTAQNVWIYDETSDTWSEQEEAIDGDLIVAGTITADRLESTQISTLGLTIGTLSSAASGARLELKDDRIQVYDSSNVVRVKIGNLS